MGNKKLSPGTIIFIDANGCNPDHFGVIVDTEFWWVAANRERLILPKIEDYLSQNEKITKQHYLYRVLGSGLTFKRYWLDNDPNEEEPNSDIVIHYMFERKHYIQQIDLLPFIKFKECLKNDIHQILFKNFDEYAESALNDAKIIYEYLGIQFNSPNTYSSREDKKLLNLLETAIPKK